MKFTHKALLTAIVAFLCISVVYSQESMKEIKIKTSSQCESCKERIEKAINKIDGVSKSDLDIESQVLTVNYDESKTNPDEIRNVVSKTGYDADDIPANPKAYKKLPKCCQKGGHGK